MHNNPVEMRELCGHSPDFWSYERTRYVDLLPPNLIESEKLLLEPAGVVRYAGACGRFWGRADALRLSRRRRSWIARR